MASQRPTRRLAAVLVIALLAPLSAPAQDAAPDETPSVSAGFFDGARWRARMDRVGAGIDRGASIGFDVLVIRPARVVALAVGCALFVPAAAVTAANRGAFKDASELFVTEPFENAFQRPLGDL
jgi:hypothetical protein